MDTKQITNDYRINEWTTRIRECSTSGLSVKRWCEDNGVAEGSYYYWLKRVRVAACEALPVIQKPVKIVPINLSSETIKSRTVDQDNNSSLVMRIGSVTMELNNSTSSLLIENVLRALQNISGSPSC